jgi:hypothetical protein
VVASDPKSKSGDSDKLELQKLCDSYNVETNSL